MSTSLVLCTPLRCVVVRYHSGFLNLTNGVASTSMHALVVLAGPFRHGGHMPLQAHMH